MHRDEYKAITTGVGAELRSILGSAASDRPPSRSQLAEMLDQANLYDQKQRAAVVKDCIALAERARDGENLFQLRQHADNMTIGHVRALYAADDLLGREPDWRDDDDREGAARIAADITAPDGDMADIVDDVNAVERARHGIA